ESRLFDSGDTLHAPHLLDIEVTHVLRRYSLAGELGTRRGREALEDFLQLPIIRYPHDLLLPRLWELRHNLSAYDAAYVALAEALSVPLITRDGRLAAATGHQATIEAL
ncbi:MAG: type II toxin-antitoxin system VapC family toxin, partial [Candidatus Competibacteraceae bacterium]|nr:type II toxin-antitoxin system VapC family toxin [Candidatus Competibacteraceae bacterium]